MSIINEYRPKTFADVVEQKVAVQSLTNRLKSGNIHHAYIFAGGKGTGKTTCARILARCLNCEQGPTSTPCNTCLVCKDADNNCSMDTIEIDAASNTGVDDVRERILESVKSFPARDRYKVFIIDECHQLSTSAFNALLKTLEEPPSYAVFILCTTEVNKLPATIVSRCQLFEFRTISVNAIKAQLQMIVEQKNITISDHDLMQIAMFAKGSLRDAQTTLGKVLAYSGEIVMAGAVRECLGLPEHQTVYDLFSALLDENIQEMLTIIDREAVAGADLIKLCQECQRFLRDLLVVQTCGVDSSLATIEAAHKHAMQCLANLFTAPDITRLFVCLSQTEITMRKSENPRLELEIGFSKALQMKHLARVESLVEQVKELSGEIKKDSVH